MKKLKIFALILGSLISLTLLVSCNGDSSGGGTDPDDINTAPLAQFIVNPDSGGVSTEFIFDASSSSDAEDEDSLLSLRWDFDGDGNFETDWAVERAVTHRYSKSGNYNAKLEVRDTSGLVSSKTKKVIVSPLVSDNEMILVEGGSFEMGNVLNCPEGYDNEKPVHTVILNSFYISKYEITNVEYCEFLNAMGTTTGQYEGNAVIWLHTDTDFCQIEEVNGIFIPKLGKENYPVVQVTWYGAHAYCEWKGGRLPTEAEWEYAARGGNQSHGYKYAGSDNLDEVGWYWDNSEFSCHPVGQKLPNELGLYDMSGNVDEWCNDWFDSNYYSSSPSDNPIGPSTGPFRVLRSGGFGLLAKDCRVARRFRRAPEYSYFRSSFRLVHSL